MIFKTVASTSRPQTTAGQFPQSILGYQMKETAGAAARARIYAWALMALGACTGVENVAAGGITIGNHLFRVTAVTAEGETELGTASAPVAAAGGRTIDLSGIPVVAPDAGADLVTERRIYMTEAGGATYYLVGTLANNTATTLTGITVDDAALVLLPAAPTSNTSGLLFADVYLAANESTPVELFPGPMGFRLGRVEILTGAVQTLIYGT